MPGAAKMTATVAVALPTKEAFHYLLPARLAADAAIGLRVVIPFRNRKEIGYILETTPHVAGEGIKEIKEIEDILDEEPLFHAGVVRLFKWMADYYRYPIGRLIQSALPGSLRITHFRAARITAGGLQVLEHLPARSESRKALAWIEANPGRRIPKGLPVDLDWQKQGWIVVEHVSEGRPARPKMKNYIRPKEGQVLEALLKEQAALLRAKNEVEFLQTLLGSHGMPKAELAGRFGNGAYLVRKWLQKGFLEEVAKRPSSRRLAGVPKAPGRGAFRYLPPSRGHRQRQDRGLLSVG